MPLARVARGPLVSRVTIGAAAVVAAALVISRAGYVPMWDGRAYADCIADAAAAGFRPYYLRCFGHSSQAYVLLTGLPYRLLPSTHVAIVVVHAALFAAACVAFHRLLRLAFPAPALAVDRAIATAAFALQPAFLAMVVQPGLDLMVLAGFLWCVVTLLERRWAWTILAGLATMFSKETGALLYGVLLACYGLWTALRTSGSIGGRMRAVARLAPLAIPLVIFGAYIAAYRIFRPAESPVWSGDSPAAGGSLVAQFLVPRVETATLSYAAMIFVMSFAWIPTLFIAADVVAAASRRLRRAAGRTTAEIDRSLVTFLWLLTAASVYFLTRFVTFSNVRYVSVAIALLLAVFLAALVRLGLPGPARRGVLGIYAVLLLISCVRTIDPVTRRVYGTFAVGSHEMLRMTSITGECCGLAGRDQLAYSLEFTAFDDLVSGALAGVEAADDTTIVLPESSDWLVIGQVDAVSHRRTLGREGVLRPRVVEDATLVARLVPLPATAWYFALPNYESASGLRKLATLYDVGPARMVERRGYAMPVYPLVLRGRAQASRP